MLLQNKFKDKKLVLCSQSPRRKELLSGLDIDFVTQPLQVEEAYSSVLKKEQITEFLCKKKAKAYSLKKEEIIITSDTLVWLGEEALEKPKNEKEAKQMLQKIANKTHEVITSVAVTSLQKQVVFSDVAKVSFGHLTEEEITYYLQKYKPYDKAGSYGVQEWIGYMGVKKIEGSYYTVMGLPVYLLYKELKEF